MMENTMQVAVAKLDTFFIGLTAEKLSNFFCIKIKQNNFDFSREARSSFRGLSFATASQLGAKRMQGKCVEDELLFRLALSLIIATFVLKHHIINIHECC